MQRLAALFALDAFAGGFIVGSFIVFWFGREFGADAALMGLVFFGVGLLQAASSVLAGWLGERIRFVVAECVPQDRGNDHRDEHERPDDDQ